MITKETNPNDTIVYSKNNCVKCKQTKMLLTRENIPYIEVNIEEINIEESGQMNEYIELLKKGKDVKLAMPVVHPKVGEPWSDFRPDRIKQLGKDLAHGS